MNKLYGYRYKPDGHVFELPGQPRHTALDEVLRRRAIQGRHGGPVTAELVERDGDGWRLVPLPDEDEAVAS